MGYCGICSCKYDGEQCDCPESELVALKHQRDALKAALEDAEKLLNLVPHDFSEQLIRDWKLIQGDVDIKYECDNRIEYANGAWLPKFARSVDEVGLKVMSALAALNEQWEK